MITEKKKQLRQRDASIMHRYSELMQAPGAMITAVSEAICKEFSLASYVSVYRIRKRFEYNQLKQIIKNDTI